MLRAEEFMIAELSKAGIFWRYDSRRRNILVSCPFHEHRGMKQKLSIQISGRPMNCWVCKASGTWNTYAEAMNLGTINWSNVGKADAEGIAHLHLEDCVEAEAIPSLPSQLRRWKGTWRGVPERTLRTIPSYRWHDDVSDADRILWPIHQFGRLVGYTTYLADMKAKGIKQRNAPGPWARKALFLIDHAAIDDRVVLTEGQFDAVRLLSLGIPACGILGTNNWTDYKASVLMGKGITRVVLAYDGDDAGWAATKRAHKDLKAVDGLDVRIMIWPPVPKGAKDESGRKIKSWDPGNCPKSCIDQIRRLLR